MKFLILALSVAVALASNPDLDKEWQMWKDTNHKKYEPEEEDYRRFVWEYNYGVVTAHNSRYALGHTSFTMAMNEFADMTNVEFSKQMNGFVMKKALPKQADSFTDISNLPTTVDWRTKGWVTPVKDQGQCGCCWAFSATGALEGQTFNKTGKLPSLSEQNLVDCARGQRYNCWGCEGGWPDGAFQYVHDNKGIDSEASYPYQAQYEECRFNPANVAATDKTHVELPAMDEKALQKAAATVGPISVAIDANHASFQLYSSGVFDESQCSQVLLNHAVLVVGYGTDNGQAYWLVKNSWGTEWGMKGYIMMSRFKNNQCGIATVASYPVV